jgi:acetolactate synthase-1/2/3 large subunit
MTHYRPTKVNFVRGYQPVPDWDEKSIEKAARLINEAQRPLVLAGHGIELANAQKEFGEMIEKADLAFRLHPPRSVGASLRPSSQHGHARHAW